MAGEGGQWEGSVTATVVTSTADTVWSIVQDFSNLHKWYPPIHTCHRISGDDGVPGLVRYCDGGGDDDASIQWCHEKLLCIDPVTRTLTYQVVDSNMGIESYTSTIRVNQMDGQDAACQIQWSFVADPIEGLRFEDLVAYLEAGLQGAVRNLEEQAAPLI